jgi:hypothetical protein
MWEVPMEGSHILNNITAKRVKDCFFSCQFGNNKWQFIPQMQITVVTAKNGSDIQLFLEEAVKNMDIVNLKKIQVILTS